MALRSVTAAKLQPAPPGARAVAACAPRAARVADRVRPSAAVARAAHALASTCPQQVITKLLYLLNQGETFTKVRHS